MFFRIFGLLFFKMFEKLTGNKMSNHGFVQKWNWMIHETLQKLARLRMSLGCVSFPWRTIFTCCRSACHLPWRFVFGWQRGTCYLPWTSAPGTRIICTAIILHGSGPRELPMSALPMPAFPSLEINKELGPVACRVFHYQTEKLWGVKVDMKINIIK